MCDCPPPPWQPCVAVSVRTLRALVSYARGAAVERHLGIWGTREVGETVTHLSRRGAREADTLVRPDAHCFHMPGGRSSSILHSARLHDTRPTHSHTSITTQPHATARE